MSTYEISTMRMPTLDLQDLLTMVTQVGESYKALPLEERLQTMNGYKEKDNQASLGKNT